MPTTNTSNTALLAELLQDAAEPIQSPACLARLSPELLDYLYIKALDLHHHVISEARDLLDVALESIEHSLPSEHQRRLIERADDELAAAQRWTELALNAQFCREHPELAQQLAGGTALREPPAKALKQTRKKSAPQRTTGKAAANG
ncbi:hypothetical protein [Lysobacter enzymogenes]|uniref:hypothetical protein n=1 Tax=Lysobacter enzymogenes TaxID=69 RepID=UPI0019D23D96|nr:hypothetical protein [Lysobacter enzymogenes]